MKLSGHTMGTPEYTLPQAASLFSEIGLDGIELIVQTDGYPCAIAQDAGGPEIAAVKRLISDNGLQVAGLTPYLNLYNSLDEAVRRRECDCLRRIIDMAAELNTGSIRIYGGKLVDGEEDTNGQKLAQLVKSMRECGDYCAPMGIRLSLENHFGTMTTTAKRTREIIDAIGHPNVGILYDQANLAFFPAEEYAQAIELQGDKIYFVHCKDLVYRSGTPQAPKFTEVSHISEEDRTVHSRIPGDGILDWPAILKKLKNNGYNGWISLEYERRWQRIDLPDAGVGMRRGAAYIRSILNSL